MSTPDLKELTAIRHFLLRLSSASSPHLTLLSSLNSLEAWLELIGKLTAPMVFYLGTHLLSQMYLTFAIVLFPSITSKSSGQQANSKVIKQQHMMFIWKTISFVCQICRCHLLKSIPSSTSPNFPSTSLPLAFSHLYTPFGYRCPSGGCTMSVSGHFEQRQLRSVGSGDFSLFLKNKTRAQNELQLCFQSLPICGTRWVLLGTSERCAGGWQGEPCALQGCWCPSCCPPSSPSAERSWGPHWPSSSLTPAAAAAYCAVFASLVTLTWLSRNTLSPCILSASY